MIAATSVCYPIDVDPVDRADAALYAAPMSHGAGIYAPIHVRMGARQLVPPSGGFDAAEVLALSADHGPTSMFMAPTHAATPDRHRQGAGRPRGTGSRRSSTAAARCTAPISRRRWTGSVRNSCRFTDRANAQWRSPRWPAPKWRIACIRTGPHASPRSAAPRALSRSPSPMRAAGPLPEGEIGEIMVRGAPVMPGYWNNPEATAKTLRDGWLMTGDMGHLDADGYLTLADRSKDVIISGGTNIYPREVEEVLLTHPSVHEVSVVGRPLGRMGRRCRGLRRRDPRARHRSRSPRRALRGPYRPVQAAQDLPRAA